MLRSELIRPRLRVVNGRIVPQRLPTDYHWLTVAQQLTAMYRAHLGQSRGALNDALRDYEADSLDYPILRGLSAVLDQHATFDNQPLVDPVTVREMLFQAGPAIGEKRAQQIAETAVAYHTTPEQIEAALFADLAEEQLLTRFEPPLPADLIQQYNLEIARGVLYWAKSMQITVRDHYKTVFKFIKLFKLMHQIAPVEDGYRIELEGPISPFVSATMRYGLQFAKFLPALLLGDRWEMTAQVRPPHQRQWLRYELDHQTDLVSHFKRSGEYDSQLEADFATEFAAKYGRSKRVWELGREDELILVDDTVMIPDFSLTHRQDGRRALIEIVGFWHPNYLRRKLEKVQRAQRSDLILLVYESANVSAEPFKAVAAGQVLAFKNKPVLKEVLTAVERCAQ